MFCSSSACVRASHICTGESAFHVLPESASAKVECLRVEFVRCPPRSRGRPPLKAVGNVGSRSKAFLRSSKRLLGSRAGSAGGPDLRPEYPVLVRLGVAYNEHMARGWESKSVEEQISAAEARQEAKAARPLSRFEIEQQTRKKGLLLEIVRLTRELESASNQRYRELLQRSLDHVQGELAKLEA